MPFCQQTRSVFLSILMKFTSNAEVLKQKKFSLDCTTKSAKTHKNPTSLVTGQVFEQHHLLHAHEGGGRPLRWCRHGGGGGGR